MGMDEAVCLLFAKTGQGVEEAFTTLARALAQTPKPASRADRTDGT